MSDELNELERQLERATAAECPSEALLDAETASLREGWLALGQLLEAARPTLEEPLELPEPARPTWHVRWRLAGVAAVAASILVGLTLVWKSTGTSRPGDPSTLSDEISVDAEQPLPGARQARLVSIPDELNWDDSLDEQITLAAQEVVRIQQDWYYLDDAFGPVYHGLEQMEEDLDQSAL